MDWGNEEVLEFLECYKAEACIWNPQHRDHKQRNKVAEAWERLHANFNYNCSLNDLKRKKDSLMASFRSHLNRMRKCINSGMTTDELSKPCWFAFEPMESFLGPLYSLTNSNAESNFSHFLLEADDQSSISEVGVNDNEVKRIKLNQNEENTESKTTKNHTPYKMPPQKPSEVQSGRIETKNKRKLIEKSNVADDSENRMEQALYHILNDGMRKEREKDQCDLYGALLANKLRRFDDLQREELMLEIDTLLLRERRKLTEVVNFNSSPSSVHSGT